MVVRHLLTDRIPELRLTEEGDPIQALVFKGAYKPLSEGIEIR